LYLVSYTVASYENNYALSFDGKDDLVKIGHTATDLYLTDFWTTEAWIKPFGDQAEMFQPNIVGFPGRHPNLELCGKTFNLGCDNPTKSLTQLREKDGAYYTIAGNITLTDTEDKWYHVAATWNNVTLDLYVDGELDVSIDPYSHGYTEPLGCSFMLCEEGIDIGGYRFLTQTGNYYSNQYFRGVIDEIRIWKIGRTQAEIKKYMNQVLTGSEPGLLYYWPFDEGQGTLVSSIAEDAYGALGGGITTAEPKWVRSDAPIEFKYAPMVVGHFNPSAIYVTASFISVVFFVLGIVLGALLYKRVCAGTGHSGTYYSMAPAVASSVDVN